ncbi:putative kinase [Cinnamomum micranthum f. kanehirae]|uniref:non-specific serine/threonine protein kinase n=1 Tax=Cinnamomum micranthum f. kanehirae TaxID=337451 RepID=A0A3S3N6Z6_9MAGN|nr:putative kinase [Cinnamomum micranthum f. kanehirae]
MLPVSFLIMVLVFVIYHVQSKRVHREEKDARRELSVMELHTNRDAGEKIRDIGKRGLELPIFSFYNVLAATDNFSVANKLGEGGFGPVYKGKFLNEQDVAVKRLSRSSGQGLEEFKNEVLLISRLQHKNLVKLIGVCLHAEEKILIYEYMHNKSLDFFLFDPTRREILDWEKRVHIIDGIAQGLLYLHKYSRLTVIHRDLKASNILLDGDMNPKISDFGLARMFSGSESKSKTNRGVGTYGYMSPEYAMKGLFSVKSDVFSFGVLLLEIMTGKKNASFQHVDCSQNLLEYAWELWNEGKGLQLIDPILVDTSTAAELMRYIHVALLCVQEKATDKPTMSEVILFLSNRNVAMSSPKQPAFFIGRDAPTTGLSANGTRPCSVNDVSVSTTDGLCALVIGILFGFHKSFWRLIYPKSASIGIQSRRPEIDLPNHCVNWYQSRRPVAGETSVIPRFSLVTSIHHRLSSTQHCRHPPSKTPSQQLGNPSVEPPPHPPHPTALEPNPITPIPNQNPNPRPAPDP